MGFSGNHLIGIIAGFFIYYFFSRNFSFLHNEKLQNISKQSQSPTDFIQQQSSRDKLLRRQPDIRNINSPTEKIEKSLKDIAEMQIKQQEHLEPKEILKSPIVDEINEHNTESVHQATGFTQCQQFKDQYHVDPGTSWGNLSPSNQKVWSDLDCDHIIEKHGKPENNENEHQDIPNTVSTQPDPVKSEVARTSHSSTTRDNEKSTVLGLITISDEYKGMKLLYFP